MRLTQKVNGILTATVFEADSLYFEKSTGYNADLAAQLNVLRAVS